MSSSTHPTIQSFHEQEFHSSDSLVTTADDTWQPLRNYTTSSIADLRPGPRHVRFSGRLVNFCTVLARCAKQPRATGWHHVLLRDADAIVSVKIYFLEPYPLHLDLLLTIYTAFLSNGATDLAQNRRPVFSQRSIPNVATVAATANLFPIRNTSDHLDLHHASETLTNELYRVPLHYTPGQAMSSLMTLHSYLAGGHEIPDARILVCVASIGPRRRVVVKSQQTHVDLCECLLADHTASIRLTLWGADPAVTPLRAGWIPHTTVLLIARPVFRLDFRGQPSIALQRASVVDTNPQFPDVCWLRGWAERRARRDSVAGRYVEAEWDVEDAVSGADRALFSLAEVDEWIRSDPAESFTGWLSLIVLDLALVSHFRKHMLLCGECCGITRFTNDSSLACPHCDCAMTLQLHPCAVGSLIDETGCLAPGQLIWRREACEDFWASGIEELARMSLDDATALEQGILGKRVNLCFGWAGHACEHEECDMTATTAETIGDDDKELAREHFQSRLVVLAVRW